VVDGLFVIPGLIDMHLHTNDLFEVSTKPIFEAVSHGVTLSLSPGAGNSLMAPALLGAEIDRGLPLNCGVYLGAPMVLGVRATTEQLISFFKGELSREIQFQTISRNVLTNLTAPLAVGIKDHMGHFILSDEDIDRVYEITSKAGMIFMSHTQDPIHSVRVADLSKGRPLHLAHMTAAGAGTHMDPVESMKIVVDLLKRPNISGEFVTTMLRYSQGSREGLLLPKKAQQICYEALEKGLCKILISDGQNDATMKGFGDTRDNIPCICELVEMGVLTMSKAVACMTSNVAELLSKLHRNNWWVREVGHLGPGARANITVFDKRNKSVRFTFVNGVIAGFESRAVRNASGAGGWVTRWGIINKTGVGDLAQFAYAE